MRKILESLQTGWIWLVIGGLIGAFVPASGLRSLLKDLPGLQQASADSHDDHDHDEEQDAHSDEEHDHVALSDIARRNLGLRTGKVRMTNYTRTVQIPGAIRERPALSDLAISAPVQGVVTHIHAEPGQAIRIGQPLFRIRLTSEALATAQGSLLDSIQQIETVNRELTRLADAAKIGGVAAKKLKQLGYEREKFELQRDNHRQELAIRGLTDAQIDEITETRKFVRHIDVAMPASVSEHTVGSNSGSLDDDGLNFTLEGLGVHPGKTVQRGDRLCDIAYHTNLYFEGLAYEKDVETLRTVAQDATPVLLELGTAGEHSHIEGLRVLHIDNYVDPETQTFRFYLAVRNSVLGDVEDSDRVFRSWRFKPGQRGHVRIPVGQLNGHFPLPREAVLMEGPDAFVFREVDEHDHDGHDHDHDVHTKEFEPIAVEVLFQDETIVVVGAGGNLKSGDKIAMNRAYDLQLAMKAGSGGGGHDHGHEH